MWCRFWALVLTCASVGSFRLACSKGRGRGLLMALELGQVFRADKFLELFSNEKDAVKGVYAVEGKDDVVKFVGIADDVAAKLRQHLRRRPADDVFSVRVQTFDEHPKLGEQMVAYKNELIKQTKPLGNLDENDWDTLVESPFADEQPTQQVLNIRPDTGSVLLELNKENVDKVLDEVRPYLIADGGNVAVVSVDLKTRSISLVLQGACGSCESSTTTMKMGIERVLKENFSNLGPIVAVDPQSSQLLTVEMVEESLSKILPAIKGLGGTVEVRSADKSTGTVVLGYKGPPKLRQGIELVLKDVSLIKTVVVNDL